MSESRTFVSETTTGSVSSAFETKATTFSSSESTVSARVDATEARATRRNAAMDAGAIAQSAFDVAPKAQPGDDSTNWLLIALLAATLTLLGAAIALRILGSSANVR